jgi:hypothetical protein
MSAERKAAGQAHARSLARHRTCEGMVRATLQAVVDRARDVIARPPSWLMSSGWPKPDSRHLLAESLRGAALDLADGSPAVNVLACATVLPGARRLRVPHGGSRCCSDG